MKTCRIPYENACSTGVRNLPNISMLAYSTLRTFNKNNIKADKMNFEKNTNIYKSTSRFFDI